MILVFNSVHSVIKGERLLRAEGVTCKIIPAPREITTECGMVIELTEGDRSLVHRLLTDANLSFKEF